MSTSCLYTKIYKDSSNKPDSSSYLLWMFKEAIVIYSLQKKINVKSELFRRKYTQQKAMYSSLLSFGQFKLKYITRTARYWYKGGIFQATNKKNLFYWVTKGFPWSVCSSQLVACVQTHLPSGKIGEGAPSPIFPEGRWEGLYTGYPLVKGLRMLGRNSRRNCINDAKGYKLFSESRKLWDISELVTKWWKSYIVEGP